MKTKKIPKLRFSEFSDEWQEKKLGEIFTERSERHFPDLELLSVTLHDGIKKQSKIGRDDISSDNRSNYKRVAKNDIVYNSMRMWQGASGVSKFEGIVSPAYTVLIPKKNQISVFFGYYFKIPGVIYLFQRFSQGLTSDTWNLKYPQLSEIKLYIPLIREQQKIADFLTAVDERIAGIEKEKELLEKYKKGMMQKIFSQKIRFKDENGKDFPDWEERRLRECLDYEQPISYIVHNTEYDDSFKIPVLTAGKSFILGHTNEGTGIFKENLPVIIFDDFTTTSQFVDFPFKVKSSAMKILKAKVGSNIQFIFEAMQQIKYDIGGHGRHWISKYSNIQIPVPSLPEQQKIADFLTSLDDKINLINKKLKQAKKFKKALLQQMFV